MSGSTAFQAGGTISANSVTRSEPGVFEEQYRGSKERLVEMMSEKPWGQGGGAQVMQGLSGHCEDLSCKTE